jgi:hypothetical protein
LVSGYPIHSIVSSIMSITSENTIEQEQEIQMDDICDYNTDMDTDPGECEYTFDPSSVATRCNFIVGFDYKMDRHGPVNQGNPPTIYVVDFLLNAATLGIYPSAKAVDEYNRYQLNLDPSFVPIDDVAMRQLERHDPGLLHAFHVLGPEFDVSGCEGCKYEVVCGSRKVLQYLHVDANEGYEGLHYDGDREEADKKGISQQENLDKIQEILLIPNMCNSKKLSHIKGIMMWNEYGKSLYE